MKARFFAIAALVLGMASCQKDFAPEANSAAEVDFQFSVVAPELGKTRAGDTAENPQNGKDSAFGAVDYFQGADWSKVDLRYTLEVYDFRADGNYAGQTPVKDRMAIVLDSYDATTFELRLAPKRDYHFVVFADFVQNGAAKAWSELEKLTKEGLNHRIGETLADIKLINEELNDEAADAYFATRKINPSNNTANKDAVTLTRPYAKVRVIATDLHELNLNVEPASVKVAYDAYNANAFNAVEGTISGKYETKEFVYNYAEPVYTEGYDKKETTTVMGDVRKTHMTLFTDYILANKEQESIQFVMSVWQGADAQEPLIKETNFFTEIPVQRNHLTTIIGNVLTTAVDVDVTIDDNFANAASQNWVFEAFVNGGEVTLDQDYTIGSTLFVEPGADVVLNLNGHTIKNTKDNQLTDVIVVKEGGKLTINGEKGYVEAVNGNDGYAIIVEGELVINGGTYTSGVDANGASNAIIYARGNGKVYVNGGFFNRNGSSNDGSFVLNKKDANRATTVIEVRGGKFRKFNPENNAAEGPNTNFVAEGYGVIEYAPNYYEVVSMATVKNEAELNAALEDKAERIRFANDITLSTTQLYLDGVKAEIDGAGYKLTTSAKSNSYSFYIKGQSDVVISNLVIRDRGAFQIYGQSKVVVNNLDIEANYTTGSRYMFFVHDNSECTVNSGKYAFGQRTKLHYFYVVADSKLVVNDGTFGDNVVNGGKLVASGDASPIEIKGGTYSSTTRDMNPTNWLAEGYKAVKNGSTWTVQAE